MSRISRIKLVKAIDFASVVLESVSVGVNAHVDYIERNGDMFTLVPKKKEYDEVMVPMSNVSAFIEIKSKK